MTRVTSATHCFLLQGKFKNFSSQALKDICIEFFYSNSKKALKNTDDFHRTIPVNGLILVAAVVRYIFYFILFLVTND
jgi:hypothetical protein